MFSFGLLSSHLSYIVFIAAYVFCFFTCSGNEALGSGTINSSEKIVSHNHIVACCDKISTVVCFYDVSDVCAKTALINYRENKSSVTIKSEDIIVEEMHLSALFSRPPPVDGLL